MTPPQEPRTGGVAVHRYVDGTDPGGVARYLPSAAFDVRMTWNGSVAEPGIWRPLAEDEAREALVAAAVAFGSCEYVQRTEFEVKLLIAVGEYIDALTKGDA